MDKQKAWPVHAIFFTLELIVAPCVAFAVAYAVGNAIAGVATGVADGLIAFFGTFQLLIAGLGYIHFRWIEQPNFRTALLRGIVTEFVIIILFVINSQYGLPGLDYGIFFISAFGTVTAFNSVLWLRRK